MLGALQLVTRITHCIRYGSAEQFKESEKLGKEIRQDKTKKTENKGTGQTDSGCECVLWLR